MKHTSIKALLITVFTTLMLLLAALVVVMIVTIKTEQLQAAANTRRYQSEQLADRLRQSSQDLTKMARTYVVTGDPRFESYFYDILAIRNGEKPRPEKYDSLYWDFVAGGTPKADSRGRAVSLDQLMREAGFTEEEFTKLAESRRRSEELTQLEVRAMNAVKGKFSDQTGAYTIEREPDPELARALMYGEQYHQAKAAIMDPIAEFSALVEARTTREVQSLRDKERFYGNVAVTLIIAMVAFAFGTFLVLRRRIITPVSALVGGTYRVGHGDYSARLELHSKDELGELASAFNSMAGSIERDLEERKRVQRELEEAHERTLLKNKELQEALEARKRMEEALRSSEGRFRAIFDQSIQLMAVLDTNGCIADVNRAATVLQDIERSDILGRPLWETPHWAHSEELQRKAQESVRGAAAGESVRFDVTHPDAQGNLHIIDFAVSPVKGKDGTVLFLLAMGHDITELTTAEAENRRLAKVFQSAADPIIIEDTEGIIIDLNEEAERAYGYARAELVGRPILELVPPERNAQAAELLMRCKAGEDVRNVEGLRWQKDKTVFPVLLTLSGLRDETGKLVGVASIAKDISEQKAAEEALREAEATRRLALDAAQVGLWSGDLINGAWTWDERVNRMMGFPEDMEPDLERWKGALHPEDRETVLNDFAAAIRGERVYDVEYRVVWSDGTVHHISARGKTTQDEGGTPVRIDGATYDRTELRAAEAAVRESEERSRLLLESAGEGIFGADAAGKVTFANPAATRMLGFSLDELLGQDIHRLVHHSHEDGSEYPPDQCPMWKTCTDGVRSDVADEVLWRKDGSKFPVGYISTPIRQEGEIIGAVTTFSDITERKEAEEQLRKLSRAIEASSVCVMITDAEGAIEYVNPRFNEVTGYTLQEVVGKNPRILNAGVLPETTYVDLWNTITAGREWRGEFCNRKKSGELYWEDASISPIRDAEGSITHYVGVKEDITERRRMEQQLRDAKDAAEGATKAKSDFLANMSHEIRTPMNGILGMTELALDTDLNPEQLDYLSTIQSSADALLTLINDILDFSKIEAGKLELEPIDFALRDALADMLNTLANRAQGKGLELIYEVPPDVPDALFGDVYRLRQIVMNLVGNAIKFTESGEVVVSIRQIESTEQNTTLQVSVQDTGIGIPADKLDTVFKAFAQADASTTRRFGGTGLGLSISVQLVELMGGRIWAESEPGQGSTFHFTVVVGFGKARPTRRSEQDEELLEGLPVLVVDDNATNRRILHDMLRNWRMSPQVVAGGVEALAALEEAASAGKPFRLVLSDVNMPEIDGFMLFERARSKSQLHDTPFVLLTSAARPGDVARCREIGVAAHLLKPVKQSQLLNTIVNAVTGKDTISPSRETPAAAGSGTAPDRTLRILLAEDNPTNQKFAVRAITKAGHSVAVANNGREAVEEWGRDRYDVVLMDVQMPEMDGFEASRRIRDLEKGRRVTQRTPIIAMTANAMKGDKERCYEAGMNGYVAKPVKRQTLFAEIARVLDENERS